MSRAGGSERVVFDGPAGPLEGLWLPGRTEGFTRAVVLCHPHPLYGGTMETKLVAHTARRLAEAGFQTLRFNFRGVGQSAGSWDGGRGERDDVEAAVTYVLSRSRQAWLAVFGMSFGAVVGLDAGNRHPRVRALVGAVPPVRLFPGDFLSDSKKPKLIVGAGRDEVVDPDRVAAWARSLPPPAEFLMIEGADHLFGGRTGEVADAVTRFLAGIAGEDDRSP